MSTESQGPTGVQHYPLDVTRLVKGYVFSVEELEHIMGTSAYDRRWSLKLLKLRRQIEQERARRGLPILTMKTRNGNLIVCDDEDASIYNHAMGKRGIRRFARATVRNLAVDATKLSAEQARNHARTLMRQGMMLAAIRSARQRPLPNVEGPTRTTPKMIEPPKEEPPK